MNPKFLTNLTSVLLACNTSFNTEPPSGVTMMRFTLKDGQVQKHEVNGGNEKITSMNVTFCDETQNGLSGIRLQPDKSTGNLSIGGQVEKGTSVCPVYGQKELIPIDGSLAGYSSITNFFILDGKFYENKCGKGKSTLLTISNINGFGKEIIERSEFPCTPFGISYHERAIVFVKDGKCKQIYTNNIRTVKDCFPLQITKPAEMFETQFYSLRFLTIMYPECYKSQQISPSDLDNTHVKFLFRQPTTVIPTTTALAEKDENPTVLLVLAGVVAFLFLVGLVVGLFIWKRPCGKKEKPMKEKEEKALGVAQTEQPKEKEKVDVKDVQK